MANSDDFLAARRLRWTCSRSYGRSDPSPTKDDGAIEVLIFVVLIGLILAMIARSKGRERVICFVDEVTWKQRQSDLRKIVAYQNNGDITCVLHLRDRSAVRD